MAYKVIFGLFALVAAVHASPATNVQELEARADPPPDNIVYVTDAQNYWWVTTSEAMIRSN